jgi:hypothetical protein
MWIREEIQAVLWKNYAPLNCFNRSSHRNLHADHLSEGQVNIVDVAKDTGTSVDQIERFYDNGKDISVAILAGKTLRQYALNCVGFRRSPQLTWRSSNRGNYTLVCI